MDSLGIYIHVPFCGKKCGYCDFYSVPFTAAASQLYCSAVLRNLNHYSDKSRITDTVYFGGGTPSLLNAAQICAILTEIKNNFNLSSDAEITIEANPNSLNPKKLSEIRSSGINRISIGVQSFSDSQLRFLGRTHSADRAKKAILDAAEAGFENISCDLMIGLPEQTPESLKHTANILTELPVQHISAYMLKTETGTPFDCSEIRSVLPDDDKTAEQYLCMVYALENIGLMQYEISNFAKAGMESRHNCRYWKCQDYIGIGPAAHSCYGGKRFAVSRDIDSFISSEFQQTYITDESPCGFEENAMLRLRLKEGLDISKTGSRRLTIEKKIPALLQAGYAEFDGTFLSLTPKGFLVSNSIIEYIVFE